MKKQKITLVQQVVTLDECIEMIDNSELPLVLKLSKEEKEKLFKSTPVSKKEKGNNKYIIKSEHIDLKKILGILYYGSLTAPNNCVYSYISTTELRNLIETNKIYIKDFIDFDGNKKYIDYIYPSPSIDHTGGIVFRDKLRIFDCRIDRYKFKEGLVGKIIDGLKINSKNDHNETIEMYELCNMTTKLTEKTKQLIKKLK